MKSEPTHYEKRFGGIAILDLCICKECGLPKVTELNFYYGPHAMKGVKLPPLPEIEEKCDNDCAD